LVLFINNFILTFIISTVVGSSGSTNWGVLFESPLLSESDWLMDAEVFEDLVESGLLVTLRQLFTFIWGIAGLDLICFNKFILGTGLYNNSRKLDI